MFNNNNGFHATVLFLYPFKTLENKRFRDIFGRYRKTIGLKWVKVASVFVKFEQSLLITRVITDLEQYVSVFWGDVPFLS